MLNILSSAVWYVINIKYFKSFTCIALVITFLALTLSLPGNAMALSAHNNGSVSFSQSRCLSSFDGSQTSGCHDLHDAPQARLQKTDSTHLLANQDEKEVCYTCHDGTTSDYNTKNDFGQNFGDKQSAHNIFDPGSPGFVLCSDCHTSHMAPDEGEPAGGWTGNEVIGLLRVWVSNAWSYLVNPLNFYDAVVNPNGWTDSEDQKRLANPSDFCGGCHQISNQYFVGSAHDTSLMTPPSNRPTTSTSTMIKCTICHQWHGADNEKMLSSNVAGVTVSANDNGMCYSCHTDPTGGSAFFGKGIFETTKHFTVTGSAIASEVTNSGYSAGYCLNCHDPHGTQFNDFRRAQNEPNDLCFTCHDDVNKAIPASYAYRGQTTYAISAHADDADSDTVWPSTAYTGNAVGGGGGALAGECINCHAPMGRDDGGGTRAFSKLLNDWAVDNDSNEQNLCFGGNSALGKCHAKGYAYSGDSDNFYSKSSVNIYDDLNYAVTGDGPTSGAKVNARHDIKGTDQNYSGASVECSSCHNTHVNNKSYDFNDNKSRVSDPDDTANNYAAEYSPVASFSNGQPFRSYLSDNDSSFEIGMLNYVNYCLKCHDANAPAGVGMGTTPPTNILSTFGNTVIANADKHGRGDGTGASLKFPYYGNSGQAGSTTEAYSAMNCTDCHDSHGSSNLYHLKTTVSVNGTIMTSSSSAVTDNTYGGQAGWCTKCHSSLPSDTDHDGSQTCGDCHYHGNTF